ncbi:SGNH/GDSL hydrolase family protein [bacterium]|nr:SGNH/GDSL hydrolase family protein [bacterium]
MSFWVRMSFLGPESLASPGGAVKRGSACYLRSMGENGSRSSRKRVLARAVLVVAAVSLSLGTAEVVLRLSYPISRSRSCCEQCHFYPWHEHDPKLGWRPRRSCVVKIGPPAQARAYEVHTNLAGLREDGDFSPIPREGTKRIAVIGDSYAFGALVASRDAFPKVLERSLAGSAPVEVMNWGVLGYGIDQMRTLLDLVLEWRPQLVIVAFIGDDLRRPIHALEVGETTRPLYVLEDGALAFVQGPDPRIDRWRDERSLQIQNPPEHGSFLLWKIGNARRRSRRYAKDEIATDARWLLGRALIVDGAKAARAKGAELAAVLLACYPPHGADFRPVLPSLEQEGIPCLDCYPSVEARLAKEPDAPLFIPDDGHPTEEGHRLIAEQLRSFIETRRLLGQKP